MPTRARHLGTILDLVMAFRPINMADATGEHVTGDWVSMRNCSSIICVLIGGAGTAGEDPTMTFDQAKTAAGGSSKTLAVVDTIYRKQAATDLLSTGVWAVTTQAAGATYVNTDAAEQVKIHCVEILATDLDVDGGFDFIRLTVPDVGAGSQLGAGLYILCGLAHPNAPANVLSPLV